jgi:hypothetical protein
MFTCLYRHCERTFSRRAALREHMKSHKGQDYWEVLNSISENSHKNLTVVNIFFIVNNFLS